MASRDRDPPIEHPLRTWRKQQGLTLSAAAAQIGATKSMWYNWESGHRRPSRKYMPRVREITGGAVNADIFYSGDEQAA